MESCFRYIQSMSVTYRIETLQLIYLTYIIVFSADIPALKSLCFNKKLQGSPNVSKFSFNDSSSIF